MNMEEEHKNVEGIHSNFILNNDIENNSSFIEEPVLVLKKYEVSKSPFDNYSPDYTSDSVVVSPLPPKNQKKMMCVNTSESLYSSRKKHKWESKESKTQEDMKYAEIGSKKNCKEIERMNTGRTNKSKSSLIKDSFSEKDVFKEVIIENAKIMNYKINDKINELLNSVLHLYDTSLKRQYISRLFRIRDVHCIFLCMFFSLLIILSIVQETVGALFSILLLLISIHLRFSKSSLVLFNCLTGLIIIDIVSLITRNNIMNGKDAVTGAGEGKIASTQLRVDLLTLQIFAVIAYILVLSFYMITLKTVRKFKMQQLWVYHNVIHWFNLFDMYYIATFGTFAFTIIFICTKSVFPIITSVILFLSSFFIYYLKTKANIIGVIFQVIILLFNLIVAAASISQKKVLPLENPNKDYQNLFICYTIFLFLFLVLHSMYMFYIFAKKEGNIVRWLSERKIYYTNIHPYIVREEYGSTKEEHEHTTGEQKTIQGSNDICFKYDRYMLYLDEEDKIINVLKKETKVIDINPNKYKYTDLHLYKHILLKTTYDMKLLLHTFYNQKSKSQQLESFKKDIILSIEGSIDPDQPDSEIPSSYSQDMLKKQSLKQKYSKFLLQKVHTIKSQKSKDMNKINFFNDRVFYFTNCKNTNYFTPSLFYSKYTHILEILYDNYEELLFYLDRKMYFIHILKQIDKQPRSVRNLSYKELSIDNKRNHYKEDTDQDEHKYNDGTNNNNNNNNNNNDSNKSNGSTTTHRSNRKSSVNTKSSNTKSYDQISQPSYSNTINQNEDENQMIPAIKSKQNYSNGIIPSESVSQMTNDPLNYYTFNLNTNRSNGEKSFKESSECYSKVLFNSNRNSYNSNVSYDPLHYNMNFSPLSAFQSNTSKQENHKDIKDMECIEHIEGVIRGKEDKAKMEVPLFWYYNPGIISRVYQEWLKCKNIDYDKMNNDFYFLLSNSNQLIDYLKSNSSLSIDRDIKNGMEKNIGSNNPLLSHVPNSRIRKNSNLSHFLLEDSNSNHSLNEIVSNFLQDSNGSFKVIQSLRPSSIHVQSFLEDKNIREFLSSLCLNGISIDQVGFQVEKIVKQKEAEEKIKEESNASNSIKDAFSNSKRIMELKDTKHGTEVNNMIGLEDKKEETFNNLGDIVEYAEFLIKDQNNEKITNMETLKDSQALQILPSHETDIKSVCSYDDVLCDFIQNLEKEKPEEGTIELSEEKNNINNSKNLNQKHLQINNVACNSLSEQSISKKEGTKEVETKEKEKNLIIKDYLLNNGKRDVNQTNKGKDLLLDSEEVYKIFKPNNANVLAEPISSFGSSEKESSLYSQEHPEWKMNIPTNELNEKREFRSNLLHNESTPQKKDYKSNDISLGRVSTKKEEYMNQPEKNKKEENEKKEINEDLYIQSLKSVENFRIYSNSVEENVEADDNSIEDIEYIQWNSAELEKNKLNGTDDSYDDLFDFTSNQLKKIEELNQSNESSKEPLSMDQSRINLTEENNSIGNITKDSGTNTNPQELLNVNIFNEIILEKSNQKENRNSPQSVRESIKGNSQGIQLHSSKLKVNSKMSFTSNQNQDMVQNGSTKKEDIVKNTSSPLFNSSIIVNPIVLVPHQRNILMNDEIDKEKNQGKSTKLKTKIEGETNDFQNTQSIFNKEKEFDFNEYSKDIQKIEEKQNETYIQYIKELKKGKDSAKKEENIQINKADLTAIFRKNELSNENDLPSEEHSNETKETPSDVVNTIYHTNTNIFHDVFGFQNPKSDSSSLSSFIEPDAIAMMVGNDVFYESYVYQSLENLEKINKVRNIKEKPDKKKETYENLTERTQEIKENPIKNNEENKHTEDNKNLIQNSRTVEDKINLSNSSFLGKNSSQKNIPSNNLNDDFISVFEKRKKDWQSRVETDYKEVKEKERNLKEKKEEINNCGDNFQISLNGEMFHITSNRVNETQRFINYEIHQEEQDHKEEKTKNKNETNVNNIENKNKENIATYYQTEPNVIKELEKEQQEEDYMMPKSRNNPSEQSNTMETPMPSSNAHNYLIHKNFYNDKSIGESGNYSDFSNVTSKEGGSMGMVEPEKESSFTNHDSSLESQELLSYEKFLKFSNLSKLSNNYESDGLKKAYHQACANLQKQYNLKTNSSSSSSKILNEQKENSIHEESHKETNKNDIKGTTNSMESEKKSDSSENQTKFLKYNRYKRNGNDEEDTRKQNRYYEESGEIKYEKEGGKLNSNYHELMNRIVNSYSFNSQESYSEKQKFISTLSNTHLRRNQPSEQSDESNVSEFAKNVLQMDSSSNLSSIHSNQIQKIKKNKKKEKKNSKILIDPRRKNVKQESTPKITEQKEPKSNSFTKFMTRNILKSDITKNNKQKFKNYTNVRESSDIIPSNDFSSQINSEHINKWSEYKLKQKEKQKTFNKFEYILNSSSIPSSNPNKRSNTDRNSLPTSNGFDKEEQTNSLVKAKFTNNVSIDGEIEHIKRKIRRNLSVMNKRINSKQSIINGKKDLSDEVDSIISRKRSFSERKKPLMNNSIYRMWVNRVEGKVFEEDDISLNTNDINKMTLLNNSSAYVSFDNESYKKANSSEVNLFSSQFSIESKYNDHKLKKTENKIYSKKENSNTNEVSKITNQRKKESTYFNYSPHSLEHFCNVVDSASEENI